MELKLREAAIKLMGRHCSNRTFMELKYVRDKNN